MSKMDTIRKIMVEILKENDQGEKYMVLKDLVRKIKEEISVEELYSPELSGIDVYRTVYQIGLKGKGFTILHDEEDTYVAMA